MGKKRGADGRFVKAESESVHTDARAFVFKAGSADTIVSNRREIEDDFVSYYETGGDRGLIRPPFDPKRLEQLVQTNNTLGPCIDAMTTNIDGTGYEIERRDGTKMEDADWEKVKPALDFLDECAPMMSFQTLRMKMRRQKESVGYGLIEIIRNAADEVVFAGPLESKMMRMGRLGNPVTVKTKMMRGGQEVEFTRLVRERRYAQLVGEKLIWFKEFGASRDLNKFNGLWAPEGQRLPADQRATEVLYFGIDPDVNTPYHVPRWINQTPSVIGSRQAEEHNLEFFSSGGIPPYLVIVEGGQLAEKTVDAVRDALNQKGAHARVQVIEAFSSDGSLDRAGQVRVKVERFGAERSNDAMFQQYDKDCEERIRKAFRLPPILIGKSQDYNFASAHASYLVAEAQVFKPERDEFDEIVNATLLPELLGTRDYVYRSKPISIVDATTQLAAITQAMSTKRVDPEHAVTLLGEIAGVEFQIIDLSEVPQSTEFEQDPLGNVIPIQPPMPPGGNAARGSGPPPRGRPVRKAELEGFDRLVGCTLAVMAAQEPVAQAAE